MAASLWAHGVRNGSWPTRRELHKKQTYSYKKLNDLEAALSTLDNAYRFRKEVECDRECGAPVYRFVYKNPRGRDTVRYGLTPLVAAIDYRIGPRDNLLSVERFSEPIMAGELKAWNSLILDGSVRHADFDPGRDLWDVSVGARFAGDF